ncbi:hypothetical protein GY45DRAFT_1328048 [Cubamyces sp. BRFM 1775]|nr:hypothetical protein GY45DRAFT_1328048 [Cubamyces sp. BRFM 1775]
MSTLAYSEWNSATAMLEFTGEYVLQTCPPLLTTTQLKGTSVAVFGTLKPAGTWNIHSAYSVDGAEMSAYVNLNPLSGEQHHVQFFSQSGLSDGTHTLTIENMGQQFWFDYVAVETVGVGGGLPPAITGTILTTSSVIASSTTSPQTPSSTSAISRPPSTTSTTSTVHPVTSPSHTTITSPPSSTTSDSTTITTTTGSSTSDSDIPSGTSTATSTQTTTGQSSPSSAGQPSTGTSSTSTVASSPGSLTTSQPGSTTSGVSPTLILGSSSEHERRGLSPGEIVGIAVGGAVALVVLLAALCVGCRRHRRLKARRVVTPFGEFQLITSITRTLRLRPQASASGCYAPSHASASEMTPYQY